MTYHITRWGDEESDLDAYDLLSLNSVIIYTLISSAVIYGIIHAKFICMTGGTCGRTWIAVADQGNSSGNRDGCEQWSVPKVQHSLARSWNEATEIVMDYRTSAGSSLGSARGCRQGNQMNSTCSEMIDF
jgi:hypothetical protein